jgi:hypothetical protein
MFAALLAAWPAAAQSGPQGPQVPQGPQGRRGERMGLPPGRPMLPAREAGQAGPPGRPPMERMSERMTPEDRRQLRQDIHQHGREVYRGRREEEKR